MIEDAAMGQNREIVVAEIGPPLSRQAMIQRKSWRRTPLVADPVAVNVWPLTVADVIRPDAFGSVASESASEANS